jgi:glycosyltransferase involved in cell wall biosynthesis
LVVAGSLIIANSWASGALPRTHDARRMTKSIRSLKVQPSPGSEHVKVLLINKFYRPNGGAETVFFATKKLLEDDGHEVVPFAMNHEDNLPSEWSPYFAKRRSYVDGHVVMRVRDSLATVYSFEAGRALRRLLRRFRPDVAHLHNVYHQLTCSVVDELHRAKIPMVMTLHDYKIVCPNYMLFTHGAPCRRCVGGSPWNAAVYRCMKGSVSGSIIAAMEATLARTFDWYGHIDRFIVPSQFLQSLVVAGGIDEGRIVVAQYPVKSDSRLSLAISDRARFVYVGRFVPEKGLDILLAAAAKLREKADILLIGRGPTEAALQKRILSERLPVEVRQFVADPNGIRSELRRSTAIIVPSISYENAPMAVLEAASVGVPAVASSIGGIPEIVEHEVTGLLFPAGNAPRLSTMLETLAEDRPRAVLLGENAWRRVQAKNDPSRYREALLECYGDVRGTAV